MTEPADKECPSSEDHCLTCSDEGVAMRVLELTEEAAVCIDPGRARHRVAIELVAPVGLGDELLVHAGVALRNLGTSR